MRIFVFRVAWTQSRLIPWFMAHFTVLGTFYISSYVLFLFVANDVVPALTNTVESVPNFILAFIPEQINADTLNTMTAFAVCSYHV